MMENLHIRECAIHRILMWPCQPVGFVCYFSTSSRSRISLRNHQSYTYCVTLNYLLFITVYNLIFKIRTSFTIILINIMKTILYRVVQNILPTHNPWANSNFHQVSAIFADLSGCGRPLPSFEVYWLLNYGKITAHLMLNYS